MADQAARDADDVLGFSQSPMVDPYKEAARRKADHEHVYRCQDCGDIGRAVDPDAYAIGYEAGKNAGDAGLYAKGYQDGFGRLKASIEALIEMHANRPIPARIDGPVS